MASPSISRCPGIQLQTQNFDNQYKCLKIGCHNASDGYLRQDYEPPVLPTGQLWTITIHENWNDPYYVGLDGIEFIDSNGSILDVLACGGSIQALPYSVTILAQDGTKNVLSIDPRIPQALLSCTTRTGTGNILASSDNHHVRPSACRCWLAPLTRRMSDAEKKRSAGPQILGSQTHSYSSHLARFPHDNCLYVMFPYPVTVSCVRLLNYSKTPARGVKEMSLHVDGRLIYMGNLKQGMCLVYILVRT